LRGFGRVVFDGDAAKVAAGDAAWVEEMRDHLVVVEVQGHGEHPDENVFS